MLDHKSEESKKEKPNFDPSEIRLQILWDIHSLRGEESTHQSAPEAFGLRIESTYIRLEREDIAFSYMTTRLSPLLSNED